MNLTIWNALVRDFESMIYWDPTDDCLYIDEEDARVLREQQYDMLAIAEGRA